MKFSQSIKVSFLNYNKAFEKISDIRPILLLQNKNLDTGTSELSTVNQIHNLRFADVTVFIVERLEELPKGLDRVAILSEGGGSTLNIKKVNSRYITKTQQRKEILMIYEKH